MAHKIKQLNQNFHEITVLRNSLHVVDKHDGRSHDLRRDRETIFFVLTSEVISRDEEKKRIVKMLTQDDPAEEDISILSIVGIRGLGKTALTKLVFNDAAVDAHFELKQWEVLQECLNGKKYLLILDNVWNEDNRKWVEFKNLLAGGASGRRIVVTTRSNRGAEITGTIPCHYYEKSLSLFLKFAFKKGKEKQHSNLAKIGQAIVKKCQGIPLVVQNFRARMAHVLLESPSKNENPYDIVNSFEENTAPGIRHMWLINFNQNPSEFLNRFGYLRSLRLPDFDKSFDKSFIETCLKRFQCLRMLDLSEFTLQVLHKWIGYLKHLRFLDLSNFPNIKKLPNSLCELHKLQTLNFHGCGQIEELPKYMRYMELTSLNTLVIAACKNLVSLPLALENLTALQSLIIADYEQLDLSRTQGFQEKVEEVVEDGFSLLSLGIVNLPKLGALPQWLLRGSANTLKNLTIADCVNLTTSVEWHNLTSLKKLAIIHCLQLSSLPNNMQRLKQLKIEYCPLLSQRCQHGTGVDWLNIAHAPFIVLDGNAISANDN
ncbi:hypothetical protein Goari_019371 [Gossypium aridum]|uniref:NB-ARC domain-containing protein n=1 Tax=Gossypium aridum TaxID=34290 RepID=A0A7J8WTK9_GOSAI|nr:hypothetical protein [Gossypium aridum]